jgi:hypothetical protein
MVWMEQGRDDHGIDGVRAAGKAAANILDWVPEAGQFSDVSRGFSGFEE